MKEICLTNGMITVVDDEDYESLFKFTWQAKRAKRTWYASRIVGVDERRAGELRRGIKMHRQIVGVDGPEVDHRDGDGLNNQRLNLRVATHQQNVRNLAKRKNSSSKFKGVFWDKLGRRWRATIQLDVGHGVMLGAFPNEEAAARAYDDAAREHFGEFVAVNFPRTGERWCGIGAASHVPSTAELFTPAVLSKGQRRVLLAVAESAPETFLYVNRSSTASSLVRRGLLSKVASRVERDGKRMAEHKLTRDAILYLRKLSDAVADRVESIPPADPYWASAVPVVNTAPRWRGEHHHGAKVTEDDVRSIRAEYDAGFRHKGLAAAIAARRGLSSSLVSGIVTRKTWNHVQDSPCDSSRANEPTKPVHVCVVCGVSFTHGQAKAKTCSRACLTLRICATQATRWGPGPSAETKDRVRELRSNGSALMPIARAVGLSYQAVRKILAELEAAKMLAGPTYLPTEKSA